MNVLVLGGTRYFGIHLVRKLLADGHQVTIATRGITPDGFGDAVQRITLDRSNAQSIKAALSGKPFDVTYDNIAYSSNDVRYLLDVLDTRRYVMTSTVSVYGDALRPNMPEEAFDAHHYPLVWGGNQPDNYMESKRQAEAALFQAYADRNVAAMRIPFVMGPDDYTKRLYTYVEHVLTGKPMKPDGLQSRIAFISSRESGAFLAWLGSEAYNGPINASSNGTISLAQIMAFVQEKTGAAANLSEEGDSMPLSGLADFSLNCTRAQALGYAFEDVQTWLLSTLEGYIQQIAIGNQQS